MVHPATPVEYAESMALALAFGRPGSDQMFNNSFHPAELAAAITRTNTHTD
jgi:hypothetical protein